jgi:hypothetical protein
MFVFLKNSIFGICLFLSLYVSPTQALGLNEKYSRSNYGQFLELTLDVLGENTPANAVVIGVGRRSRRDALMKGLCALALTATMNVNLQIVMTHIQEFNQRNFDLLFSKYFSPQLEVYQQPHFMQMRELIRTLNDPGTEHQVKEKALEAAIAGHDQNMFPDLEILKGHVKRQFASEQELHIDVLEQAAFKNYVVTFERKKRDGIVVDAVDIYFLEDGMIRKMWIAKASVRLES